MTGIPNGLFHGKMILISGTPTAPTRETIYITSDSIMTTPTNCSLLGSDTNYV
jgi:hypothetical protein